jgi:hypothetical protein
MLGSKTYLLVVVYMSRYVEIALLTSTKSNDVINHLKSIYTLRATRKPNVLYRL